LILLFFFNWGNPNIGAMNRQLPTDENDQYQFSKKTDKNMRFAYPEYLRPSSTWIITEIL